MKKLRIALSIMAVLLATGATLAVKKRTPQPIVYDFLDRPGTADDECIAIQFSCEEIGTIPCKLMQSDPRQLRRDPSPATMCGPVMWRD